MKKLIYSAFALILLFAQSCVGPEGPPGPQGFDGFDGADGADGQEAFVFEYVLDFETPDYSVLLEYPNGFTALDSDVVLVYMLWDKDGDTEIWRMLPQSMITEFGFLQYNFDFTKFDTRLFLDADFNLDNLGSQFLDNWLARVVVVPGQFTGRMDYSDYNAVKEMFNLPDKEIPSGYVISARPE